MEAVSPNQSTLQTYSRRPRRVGAATLGTADYTPVEQSLSRRAIYRSTTRNQLRGGGFLQKARCYRGEDRHACRWSYGTLGILIEWAAATAGSSIVFRSAGRSVGRAHPKRPSIPPHTLPKPRRYHSYSSATQRVSGDDWPNGMCRFRNVLKPFPTLFLRAALSSLRMRLQIRIAYSVSVDLGPTSEMARRKQ